MYLLSTSAQTSSTSSRTGQMRRADVSSSKENPSWRADVSCGVTKTSVIGEAVAPLIYRRDHSPKLRLQFCRASVGADVRRRPCRVEGFGLSSQQCAIRQAKGAKHACQFRCPCRCLRALFLGETPALERRRG